jgi:hypothetical protein
MFNLKYEIMKTKRIAAMVILLAISLVAAAQNATSKPAVNARMNTYYVQISHTPGQCLNMLSDLKGKGDTFLSKFEFGCMEGDHTAYGFLQGKSEQDVRMMLPKEEQSEAKIQKVDRLTADQITKLHQESMHASSKK